MPETKLTPEQIETIVDQNGELYRRDIIQTTFKTRVPGFLAGSGMGLLYGVMLGALVVASPLILSIPILAPLLGAAAVPLTTMWPAVVSMIPHVLGIMGLGGMGMGAAMMTSINASAGAAVGLEKVEDRKKLLNNPDQALADTMRYRGTSPEPEKKGLLAHILPSYEGSRQVFSIRNALIFGALALGVAALFALPAVALLPGLVGGIMGVSAAPAVLTCMGLATATVFGISMGFDFPTMSANATKYAADVLGGKKIFPTHKAPAPALPEPSPMYEKVSAQDATLLSQKLDAASNTKNFAQMVQQSQSDPATTLSRA